jgi:hypothetical protein
MKKAKTKTKKTTTEVHVYENDKRIIISKIMGI